MQGVKVTDQQYIEKKTDEHPIFFVRNILWNTVI